MNRAPDALRLRGLLKSPHAKALTVAQMDAGIAKHLREKHAPLEGLRMPRNAQASDGKGRTNVE